jgi:hypothetical protein
VLAKIKAAEAAKVVVPFAIVVSFPEQSAVQSFRSDRWVGFPAGKRVGKAEQFPHLKQMHEKSGT